MRKRISRIVHATIVVLAFAAVSHATVANARTSVTLVDLIPAVDRDYFNGFEGIPDSSGYTNVYQEGGIRVEQVNGDANGIWTTFMSPGFEGANSWYPNGGDNGYTKITLTSGAQFGDVGLLRGSGNGSHNTIYYQLLLGGVTVLSGQLSHTSAAQYLGFLGGGFDTILLRDGPTGTSLLSGTHNALAIDSIEVRDLAAVPEPTSLGVVSLGLIALAAGWRRRRR